MSRLPLLVLAVHWRVAAHEGLRPNCHHRPPGGTGNPRVPGALSTFESCSYSSLSCLVSIHRLVTDIKASCGACSAAGAHQAAGGAFSAGSGGRASSYCFCLEVPSCVLISSSDACVTYLQAAQKALAAMTFFSLAPSARRLPNVCGVIFRSPRRREVRAAAATGPLPPAAGSGNGSGGGGGSTTASGGMPGFLQNPAIAQRELMRQFFQAGSAEEQLRLVGEAGVRLDLSTR